MALASVDDQPMGLRPCEEKLGPLEERLNTMSIKEHDDEDSDADSDVPAHEPKTASEKRRRQNQILEAFAANISAHVTQQEVKEAASKSANEEQLSIREILAKQETSVRITTPRDYQTELFQKAKRENTIAVLDTGSGKTHIATLLLQHILDEELTSRAGGGVHKTAFFLVNSVNLVFQQANVLECGLDQPVAPICGAMGTSLWRKSAWTDYCTNNMVIVCTAEVLVQCLMHSFISMAEISLLIFDEAHHAKSHHSYARIMRDYYIHETDISRRPRIFGMTASPIDARGLSADHIKDATTKLEKLLDSKIATISEQTLALNNISRPIEEVVQYASLKSDQETSFYRTIKARFGDFEPFKKFFIASKRIGSELGPWASDVYWSFAFADEQSSKLRIREEYQHNKRDNPESVEKLNAKMERLKEATDFVQQHDFGLPTLTESDLSSKVLLLYQWLHRYYERSDEPRCIVFVEQRQTARLLKLVFDHIGGPNLHCDILIGINSYGDEHSISLRNQILTVSRFRRGELNCVFATSVAEEGLDIPQCNLVVRFDLYRTMIGYVQSRGRARHRNSKYLHMIEQGNHDHVGRLGDVRQDERIMRNFCNDVSSDRRLDDASEDTRSMCELEERSYPSYTDPGSGAKLTYRTSLSILAHFVATLPTPNRDTQLQPTYVISVGSDTQRTGFHCEVILPECSPVTSATGRLEGKKTSAKCSAAFTMCLELRKKGHLDSNLLPTTTKYLPAMRNALLAVSGKKKGHYPMLIKPSFWKRYGSDVPERLFLTIVDVDAGLDRSHQPLGLFTRGRLPQLPSFPIYLADGKVSNVISRSLAVPLSITTEALEMLTTFTFHIYGDIYNKHYEYNVGKMSYWIVPIRRDQPLISASSPSLEEVIDMEQVHAANAQSTWQWTPQTPDRDLTDKYIVDPLHGGRRFYSKNIATHLSPHDPVPGLKPRGNKNSPTSILHYSDSRYQASRDLSRWCQTQPVVEVEKIPFRRNLLAEVEEKERSVFENLKTYVCVEPLRISKLEVPFVAMCYVLPAIIHRFEGYLIACDACDVLDIHVSPALALEALTKDSENSGDHEEEKIRFKSGMGPNYERLEFLGDCFLKMATSISIFVRQPEDSEFDLHVNRMVMLCNQNLLNTAVGTNKVKLAEGKELDLQLYKYVRTEAFSRRTWYPEGLKLLRGKGWNKSEDDWLKLTHNLSDKSIADVCEAFIGAAFMQHYKEGQWAPEDWDEAVKAVRLFANSPDHPMTKWSDYYAAYTKPQYQVAEATATQLDLARKVESKHPYHFRYPRLLRSAFVHPSQPFMWEAVPNYQRLEFLGDSLLDMAFITYLYYKYPDKDPHWLTEHKTPMVSNKFLGAVCVKLEWHKHIRQNNSMLSSQIRDYVMEVQEAERESDGAIDYWVVVSEPPKCLADVVEAYVAAIFVDAEFDFTVVRDFFDKHLKPFFLDMTLDSYQVFARNHPTTRLGRLLSGNFGCKDWRMGILETDTVIPGKGKAVAAMVLIHDKVHFYSMGQSGRYARVRVSQEALEKLDGLPPFEFRSRYRCDCAHGEADGDYSMEEVARKEAMGPNT